MYFRDGLYFNYKATISTLFYVLLIWCSINLFLFMRLPDGIMGSSYYANKIHFLGSKNGFSGYTIPLLVLAFISNKYKYCNKIIFLFGVLVALVTAIISDSSTGIMSVAALLFFILVMQSHKGGIRKYRKYIFALLLLSAGIVFFRIQTYFSFFIEGVLGKTVDLTNRTVIWDAAIAKIKESPLIGSGLNQYTGSILIGETYYYSHNMILELLVSSGIVGLFLYLNFIFSAFKKYISKLVGNGMHSIQDLYEKNMAIGGIIAFFVTAITEAPIFKLYLFMCLMLLQNTSQNNTV